MPHTAAPPSVPRDSNTTRDDLLDAGRALLLRAGYAGTGLKDVLAAAGVPKGSFYHYFDSKAAFGLAALDAYFAEHAALLDGFLADRGRPPLARLRAYFEAYADRYAADGYAVGCLLGTLAQEQAGQDGPDGGPEGAGAAFRPALAARFAAWRGAIAAVLREARDAGALAAGADGDAFDADALAAYVLDAWEGALLQMKVARSDAPLRTFLAVTFGRVLTPP